MPTTAKPPTGTPLPPSHLLYPYILYFWPFNDASGTTLVDVKGGKNATVNLPAPASITWTTNDKGEPAIASAATTSTTAGASFSALNELGIPIGTYSIEFRFNPGISDAYGLIIGYSNGSAGSIVMLGSKVQVFGTGYAGETTAPVAGTWHHVVLSVSDNQITYYLDGVADGGPYPTTNLGGFTTMFNDTPYSETFVGKVDYIRIWNRPLTTDEIVSLRDDPMQVFNGGENPQPMMFVTT